MSFDEDVLNYDVSRETLQKIKDFMQILLEWNKKINLISKNSETELEYRHVLDSLQLIKYVPADARLLLDVGSGSGFPGIILAIALQEKNPQAKVVLIESIIKKSVYLKDVCHRLSLSNVEVINNRAENIVFKKVDCITARAVAAVDKLLGFIAHCCTEKTKVVLLKGKTGEEELTAAAKNWQYKIEVYENAYSEQNGYVYCMTDIRKRK